MSEEAAGDVTTGVTWSDIYESPEVERSLRRLPRLCRDAIQLVWAAGRRELLVVLAIKAVNGSRPRPSTPGPSTSCSASRPPPT
jgi:hypothetical protein